MDVRYRSPPAAAISPTTPPPPAAPASRSSPPPAQVPPSRPPGNRCERSPKLTFPLPMFPQFPLLNSVPPQLSHPPPSRHLLSRKTMSDFLTSLVSFEAVYRE